MPPERNHTTTKLVYPCNQSFYPRKIPAPIMSLSRPSISSFNIPIKTAAAMRESDFVRSAAGDWFNYTSQLKVTNYNDTMATDKADEWDKSAIKENQTF
eukprot:3467212-Ditylum_brightwellii.AAC.1